MNATQTFVSIAVVASLMAIGSVRVSGGRAMAGAGQEPARTDSAGARDPAWSPDGRRLALTLYDRVYLQDLEGKIRGPLVVWDSLPLAERDPAWSPDGSRLAFAADTGTGFDLYIVEAAGGRATRLTMLAGDERWPSWTRDGRVVFAVRDDAQWDLAVVSASPPGKGPPNEPRRLTQSPDDEIEPAVSPDGARVAFVSNRENDDGDLDVWEVGLLPGAVVRAGGGGPDKTEPERVARTRGDEHRPSWAPDGERLVASAVRDGVGTLWVFSVPTFTKSAGATVRDRPLAPPVLVSRRAGLASWSPDGRTLAMTSLPLDEPGYNGNPLRDPADPPPAFSRGAFQLRLLPAPRRPDDDVRVVPVDVAAEPTPWGRLFDRVWGTLDRLYYRRGPSSEEWQRLARKYRPRASAAPSETAFEDVIDQMMLEQPLIKESASSQGAMVVSGHPLASQAGVDILQRGGNIVDAAIAVSFALGVVEPDASGIGGDGMAVLYLQGMREPVVIDFKDQAPSHATADNASILRDGRIVADGPAAANIPGVVAGLDHLYQRYGSKHVAWKELVAPAVTLAERGFDLDASLPTTVAEGRGYFEKYEASSKIFLPNGRVPKPGERFINRDYGRTLRTLAAEGGDAFYRGSLAGLIARDLQRHGGIIRVEDLAQYRAVERRPVMGSYRGYRVYSTPPPVASGVSLIETLQILDNYAAQSGARVTTDPDYFHYLLESWKARDSVRRIADPALWPVDLEDHLEITHARERFQRIRRGSVLKLETELDDQSGADDSGDRIGRGTTAFVVADAAGNVIAVTQTLSTWGGTFYVSEGLGFLYNNHLRSNRIQPSAYGHLLPLMRSTSTNTPTLVFRPSGDTQVPWLALGAAGNAWITSSVYGVLTALVDGRLPVQAAIEAPRFLVTRDPTDRSGTVASVQIEDRFPRATLDELEQRGHRFIKIGRKGEVRYGYAAAAVIDTAAGRVEGGADPRRSHAAIGWQPHGSPSGAAATRRP